MCCISECSVRLGGKGEWLVAKDLAATLKTYHSAWPPNARLSTSASKPGSVRSDESCFLPQNYCAPVERMSCLALRHRINASCCLLCRVGVRAFAFAIPLLSLYIVRFANFLLAFKHSSLSYKGVNGCRVTPASATLAVVLVDLNPRRRVAGQCEAASPNI